MVVNPSIWAHNIRRSFESYVISYGSEPVAGIVGIGDAFESYVISYGSEPQADNKTMFRKFESYVISYGSEPKRACGYVTILVWELCNFIW